MSDRKALGRGLGALLGEGRAALDHEGGGRLRELPRDDIAVNRRQPRREFDEEELQELAASIKALGMVQPVVVRPLAGAAGQGPHFELIAGERRLRAARLAGLTRVPALVRAADELASLEIALAENVAREDLNAIEEAQAYRALVDEFGLTHEEVAHLVGRSRTAVSNLLRLLDLPDEVQAMVERGELSEGHARALLALPGHDDRRRAAQTVAREGLTVRQTEALVRRLLERGGEDPAPRRSAPDPELDALTDDLYGVLQVPVRIRAGRRGGAIEIRFRDRDELERLLSLLRRLGGDE